MRRGEIWRYTPAIARPGQPTLRLVVSADFLNTNPDLSIVLALQVLETDPDSLMAFPVGDQGWARALSVEPVLRRRLVEHVGTANAAEMDQVNNALRAVQDL